MKIKFNKQTLLNALAKAATVATKSHSSHTECVLIEAGDSVALKATSLDRDLVVVVDGADVESPGAVAVNAKDLASRVKNITAAVVAFELKQAHLLVRGGSVRYYMPFIDVSEVPQIKADTGRHEAVIIGAKELSTALSRALPAVSNDVTRAHVNSALVEVAEGTITVVSTDGHRLSLYDAPCPADELKVLIPKAAAISIVDLLSGLDGDATVRATASRIHIAIGNVEFSAALTTSAAFPPYRQVIPHALGAKVRVEKSALVSALKSALVSSKGGVVVDVKNGVGTVEADSGDGGSGNADFDVIEGNSMVRIGLNGQYLLDAMAFFDTPQVDIFVTEELSPMLIKPVSETANESAYVVMPMKI